VIRFSLCRTYLGASSDQLRKQLRHLPVPNTADEQSTSWLKLACIGQSAGNDNSLDPSTALQVALAACHRPNSCRLSFAVQSDGKTQGVFLGLRSMDASIESSDIAMSTKAFIEANWPATRLVPCNQTNGPERLTAQALQDYDGRFALTGVPTFLDRERSHHAQSLDLLLDGLRGRRFCYMVTADPIPAVEQDASVSRARDLIGALHAFGKMTVTHQTSTTFGISEGKSTTETLGFSKTQGRSGPYMGTMQSLLALAGMCGGGLLAPLLGPLGLVGGMGTLAWLLMSQSQSQGAMKSSSTAEAVSKTVNRSVSKTNSIAREYINAHIEAVESQLRHTVQRMEGHRLWLVGAHLLTDYERHGQDATAQLSALLNGSRRHGEEPIRFVDLGAFWKGQAEKDLAQDKRPRFEIVSESTSERLQHPLGKIFEGLSTPLNTDELSLLVSFPRREVPGVLARPFASFALNAPPVEEPSIILGEVLRGDDPTGDVMRVSLNSLCKNALVAGAVGTGKSTTCRRLLVQLKAARKPFLVLEPAKSEYVTWARKLNESLPPDSPDRIKIYMPGVLPGSRGTDHAELRLNPFEVLAPDDIIMHISRLKTLLTSSLPMQEALPMLLEGILYGAYAANGWFTTAPSSSSPPQVPTISQILNMSSSRLKLAGKAAAEQADWAAAAPAARFLDDFVRRKGYEERVSDNFVAALETRFQFLREGWKAALFDSTESTPPQDLYSKCVVVNLSRLSEDDRSLAAGLILSRLHEWRQYQHERQATSGNNNLEHVVVLEEAHCLLEPVRHIAAESMDPKGMVSRMFSELLSEMRAWGQGFIVVDQYPTRLILDAVKNTNLKIIHRLPARDDQDVVSAAMSLDPTQARLIAHLLPGQAIAMGDLGDAPLRIRIHPCEAL
jgi:hypothetical protein